MKETLPAYVQPIGKIAHVHQPQLLELLAHRGIELLENLAAIHNRRTAAFLGREHAEKTDSRRPRIHVRAFVVIQNRLVFGIRRRGINLSRNSLARQIAVLGVNLVVNGSRDPLELGGR